MEKIGFWKLDENQLPEFCYTDTIPYQHKLENGKGVNLPEDPFFLLGNYKLTMFTHVSGMIELLSAQRAWARINQGKENDSGDNRASITLNGKAYKLVGMDSLAADPKCCQRNFGCGKASYEYEIGGVKVTRKLSVKPSMSIDGGTPSYLCEVTIENNTSKEVEITYQEDIGLHYKEIPYDSKEDAEARVKYRYQEYSFQDREEPLAYVEIEAHTKDPLLMEDREAISLYECFPPVVFMKGLSENAISKVTCGKKMDGESATRIEGSFYQIIPSGEKTTGKWLVGFGYEDIETTLSKAEKEFASDASWDKVIPDFLEENKDYNRELKWHVYNLEAMATYSDFYKETKIPQGTIYDYGWGAQASARDHFQHALPLVYYNQPLAKSVLKYMLKRTTPFGEIRLIEKGFGYAENERYFTSDQQLYFMLLLSEYLRVTGDYGFLRECITPYPVKNVAEMPIWELVKNCFIFLRDTIGRGEHGLIRLLNSDWNDAVYYIIKVPYNTVFFTGESHMNSAMAISILQNLIPELEKALETVDAPVEQGFVSEKSNQFVEKMQALIQSMNLYRGELLEAFLKDMGERSFPRRMYFGGKAYGEDNMFLEPQGFTLQIAELSKERKTMLYEEMQKRVYLGEKIGAREQQNPEFEDEEFDKGSRENGGFWWALNGPVIVAMNDVDSVEARRLWENMTLKNLSEKFPEYWTSYWSASDNLESSLIPEEGLPDQSMYYWRQPIYCAHPHAWILYCWYRLHD